MDGFRGADGRAGLDLIGEIYDTGTEAHEWDELIETAQGGYALRINTDSIDATRFEASIETARRQLGERDPIAAAATLRRGLAMWHGNAYEEFAFEEWAQPEAARLEELKAVAHEELNDALLASGLAHDVVLKNPISAGQSITWNDVQVDESRDAVVVRRQMEAHFRRNAA